MRKIVMLPLLALLLVIGLSGCGGGQPVSYAPAAYGQNGQCYYVDDPYEVTVLQQQGLCQRSWTPFLMPLFWHQMYYPYYSSPGYVNTFVVVSHRTTYVTHERSFGNTYKSQISSASKTAKYKGSNGKIVTGNKVNTNNMKGSRNSGGSGSRTKTCSLGPISTSAGLLFKGGGGGGGGSRGGSSGGSRSSSSGGGSRSGSSSGGSKSRSKTGC
jgi:hypothetical protein